MKQELKVELFNKFRSELSGDISDKAIEKIVQESMDRYRTILRKHPSELLNSNVVIEIDDNFWSGDIRLYTKEEFGISWIFDRKMGWLHTT